MEIFTNSGTVRCCPHLISMPVKPVSVCRCCQNYAKIRISITDLSDYEQTETYAAVDNNLLHDFYTKDMLTHDPYTPESAESHSPLPEEKKKSVSPRILKSRLENILRNDELCVHKKLEHSLSDNIFKSKPYLSKSQSQILNHLQEPTFRQRCMTEGSRKVSKAKLLSSAQSIHRLQSHHSSSDEEWFVFEEVELKDDIFEEPAEEKVSDLVQEERTEKRDRKNKKRQKIDACCILS